MGSHLQKQSLIVDTGSSMAAVPCAKYCTSENGSPTCGKHIYDHYDFDSSSAGYTFNCLKEKCTCTDDGKCKFYQGYMEGSSYSGFMVEDQVYFGDSYHLAHDAFMFSFGCVSKETNLFYNQRANGILGMAMGTSMSIKQQKPIYEAMYDA